MTWLDFVVLVLAVGTPINVWLYEESILAGWREWIFAWAEFNGEESRWRDRLRYKLGELLSCRFCMSHWVPIILIVLFYLPSLFIIEPWSTVVKLPVYSLAATRAALCLSIMMKRCRLYPPNYEDPGDNQE